MEEFGAQREGEGAYRHQREQRLVRTTAEYRDEQPNGRVFDLLLRADDTDDFFLFYNVELDPADFEAGDELEMFLAYGYGDYSAGGRGDAIVYVLEATPTRVRGVFEGETWSVALSGGESTVRGAFHAVLNPDIDLLVPRDHEEGPGGR